MSIEIDIDRLMGELEHLATFSDAPPPAVTRVVFTDTDLAARAFVRNLCESAGLAIRSDAVGNTFARWEGSEPSLKAVATGSHIDAIPNAGKYDGTVGVLGGLEAIRALRESGFQPRRSIELLLFTSEEPTRFGIGCLGSRLLSGNLKPDAAERLADSEGRSLNDVRRHAGFEGGLEDVALRPSHYAAFLELHIEQGPILEREGILLGVVTDIAAPASMRILVEGEGGHAGGMLMPDRHDALAAAAEIILATENAALQTKSIDTVATVGVCEVFPGAVNSVPNRVRLELDVRDTNEARRDDVLREIRQEAVAVAAKRGVSIECTLRNADAPAQCSPIVVSALQNACSKQACTYRPMVSRAYHDSLFMSRIVPTGMLFIPCRNGVSHRPDEYASVESIEAGTRVLADALALLTQ
ncbi:MAG TPA: M20 family metallo-hydrolase [Bryobacteraceae bacterium]|jgi:N-carbamoyl-L-amino-acid hydrolase|nr:M20 family metallo-hydrolase [Bryobacteraceae bacterium]